MSADKQRGSNYLERVGIIPTWRNPQPRMEPRALKIHSDPDAEVRPLPLPELQDHLNGDPAPDRGQTLEWPHPRESADESTE